MSGRPFGEGNVPPNKLTRLQEDEIVAAIQSGASYRKIATTLGRSLNTVSRIAIERGLSRPPRKKPVGQSMRTTIIELLDAGWKQSHIVDYTGASSSYVSQIAGEAHGAADNEWRRAVALSCDTLRDLVIAAHGYGYGEWPAPRHRRVAGPWA